MSVAPNAPATSSAFSDPTFASTLLSSADPNDPLVQAALAQLQASTTGGTQLPPAPPSKEEEGEGDGKDEAGKKRKGGDV